MGFITKKWWLVIIAVIVVLVVGATVVIYRPNSPSEGDSQRPVIDDQDEPQLILETPTNVPLLASDDGSGTEPNQLINEKSPYLLQHAYNPVDWYPWGEKAFEKARQENKPIFLSIGYSTCHWCHVMEEESFDDPEVAQMLNDTFVSIMVDREERPDIDSYYLNVAAVLSGSGGWPLNIMLTPDLEPFYATTYIPKNNLFGRVGMLELIPQVQLAWLNQDQNLLSTASQVNQLMDDALNLSVSGELVLDASLLEKTFQELSDDYDGQNGGFGEAPKFPTAHRLLFLLRYWERTGDEAALKMVETSLQAMRRGGIYDQIGFGFHRYATDAGWLVPHFEKMLYDQALLAVAYIEAYQATGKQEYEQVAREIFTYVLRDMTDPEGAFYSAEDADSEGEEGKFYVWTVDEIRQVLSEEEAGLIIAAFNVAEEGNFVDPAGGEAAGDNILHLTQSLPELAAEMAISEQALSAGLASAQQQLFASRAARIHPHKDDKILTDWNGLMIAALAKGGRVFADDDYTRAAQKAADFVLENAHDERGRISHRYRDGEAAVQANIDDYAFLIWGLLELYETTFDTRYLKSALELSDEAMTHYWDDKDGGFYFTPDDGEDVIGRQRLIHDGDLPSGNSVMMLNLIRLGRLTANPEFDERGMAIGHAFAGFIKERPSAYSQLMNAVDFGVGPSYEVVIIGEKDAEDTQMMLAALQGEFVPNKVVLLIPPEGSPEISQLAEYTKYYSSRNDRATAYVCQDFYCELPTNDIGTMLASLGKG